jgi:hypothetical protein
LADALQSMDYEAALASQMEIEQFSVRRAGFVIRLLQLGVSLVFVTGRHCNP